MKKIYSALIVKALAIDEHTQLSNIENYVASLYKTIHGKIEITPIFKNRDLQITLRTLKQYGTTTMIIDASYIPLLLLEEIKAQILNVELEYIELNKELSRYKKDKFLFVLLKENWNINLSCVGSPTYMTFVHLNNDYDLKQIIHHIIENNINEIIIFTEDFYLQNKFLLKLIKISKVLGIKIHILPPLETSSSYYE